MNVTALLELIGKIVLKEAEQNPQVLVTFLNHLLANAHLDPAIQQFLDNFVLDLSPEVIAMVPGLTKS